MKCPEGREEKWSLPGKIMVLREILSREPNVYGPHVAYDEADGLVLLGKGNHENSMRVVYDGTGETDSAKIAKSTKEIKEFYEETFQDVRDRLNTEWIQNTPGPESIDEGLKRKQKRIRGAHSDRIKAQQGTVEARFTYPTSNLASAGNSILRILNKTLQNESLCYDNLRPY
jgi:hypothetical protein